MAFAYTVSGRSVYGNKRIAWGTFTNGLADTGGDIVTGLKIVEFISLQLKGIAVDANAPVVNETLPLSGGNVTIVTTADADGYWWAFGV
ncbi:MAG: hypothetical protein AB1467_06785 [Candidatus Diapherotrites archaeon]